MGLNPEPVLSLPTQPWAEMSALQTLPVSPGSRPWGLPPRSHWGPLRSASPRPLILWSSGTALTSLEVPCRQRRCFHSP